ARHGRYPRRAAPGPAREQLPRRDLFPGHAPGAFRGCGRSGEGPLMTALSNHHLTNGHPPGGPAVPGGLPTPPSGLQAIRILARTALARWLNRRVGGGASWWRKKPAGEAAGGRKATPGKEFTLIWNSLLVALVFLCVGNFLGCMFVLNEGKFLSQRGQEGVQEATPGADSQRATDDDTERLLHSGAAWPLPPDDRLMVLAVGLALALLSLCQLT